MVSRRIASTVPPKLQFHVCCQHQHRRLASAAIRPSATSAVVPSTSLLALLFFLLTRQGARQVYNGRLVAVQHIPLHACESTPSHLSNRESKEDATHTHVSLLEQHLALDVLVVRTFRSGCATTRPSRTRSCPRREQVGTDSVPPARPSPSRSPARSGRTLAQSGPARPLDHDTRPCLSSSAASSFMVK